MGCLASALSIAAAATTAPVEPMVSPAFVFPLPKSSAMLADADAALAGRASGPQSALAAAHESERHEERLFVRPDERELLLSFERAVLSRDPQRMATVERAVRASLGDLLDRTPAELAALVSAEGAVDARNFEMRDACLHFAMLYGLTGDRSQADRTAAILARFAAVIPQWPIMNPYYAPMAERRRDSQSSPGTFASEYAAGLWGKWIYMDLVMGTPLVQARAFIARSGALADLGADSAVSSMFELHLATQRKFGAQPDYSNMDSFQIRGKLDFGRYLPDPQLVHDGVSHLKAMFRVGFYPDGWWHEGSPAYHGDLVNGLKLITSDLLAGYSDPSGFRATDGTRFDGLDLAAEVRAPLARAESIVRRTVLPDQTMMGIHDTPWPTIAPSASSVPSRSFLFGAMGQGTLVSGTGAAQALATLHWSRAGSHAHFDALSLFLWAKGTEAISGTQYRPLPGSASKREWHQSTAAFATVVVDGLNQSPVGPSRSHRRSPGPDDVIPGLPDSRWRWGQSMSCNDAGDLRLFSTEFPEVQVIEADAVKAYDAVADISMYRRTVALVRIDEVDSYVVDIFRVRGGQSHDYMLHSALQMTQQLRVSTATTPLAGAIHGWIGGLCTGSTSENLVAAFELDNGVKLLSFIAGAPGTSVVTGQAPAMRRNGDAPFLAVRRTGGDSTFVAVHHVVAGSTSRVNGIELIPTDVAGAVALRVKLGDRVDTIVSSVDRGIPITVAGGMTVRGAFAHSRQGGGRNWALLVDGDLLRTQDVSINGSVSHEGVITSTASTERGDGTGGFGVSGSVPSLSSLAGAPIIVDQGGVLSWAYRVESAGAGRSGSWISSNDEPGFEIDGNLIKQTCFPNWGIRGSARYRIPGYAVMCRDEGRAWNFVQTGSATGSVVSP